ncbi:hypothetical protein Tco_1107752 [Tanacetum coccineum]
MNQNFNYSNSFGFDQIQPPQQFDNHHPQEIPEVISFFVDSETKNELYTMMEDFMKRINQQSEQEALLVAQREQELREQEQAAQEKEEFSPKPVFRQLIEEMCGTKPENDSENVDTIIESPSPSPIPVEDSDSHMEEIDLFLASDDSMPPGIENDDYDSEGDIHFLKELLSNDPFTLPKIESSNLDHFDDTDISSNLLRTNTGGEIDVFANVEE